MSIEDEGEPVSAAPKKKRAAKKKNTKRAKKTKTKAKAKKNGSTAKFPRHTVEKALQGRSSIRMPDMNAPKPRAQSLSALATTAPIGSR